MEVSEVDDSHLGTIPEQIPAPGEATGSAVPAEPADATADKAREISRLPLSEDEERVLALYDRLEELKVELAIATGLRPKPAQGLLPDDGGGGPGPGPSPITDPDGLRRAQVELLESRADYLLRKRVVETIMAAGPILKSVHRGSDASPIEEDLLPLIEQRDDASLLVARQDTELHSDRSELAQVRAETFAASRRNVDLASELLRLVEDAAARRSGSGPGTTGLSAEAAAEVETLRRAVKASRQKWKVMKGAASAIVAGSGVDWAASPELRDIVLDPEE